MSSTTSNSTGKKLRILFFTSALATGGAEMHMLRVINHLDREQFEPLLAVVRSGGSYESALRDDVKIHVVGLTKKSSTLGMASVTRPLRRLIEAERPDVICSFLDHASTMALLTARRLSYQPKLVLGVQNPPSIQYRRTRSMLSRLMLASIVRLYPRADKIVALTRGVGQDIVSLSPRCAPLIEVIHNAGMDERVLQGAAESLPTNDIPRPLLVACGRLTEQKGYPYLLEAYKQVREKIPAHLWILGQGHLREEIEATIQREGWQDCVRLLGFQGNPYQYMAAADIFVLSSIYEGFGNVIVEAMASGAPIVSTDCPYGPGEIIENGKNGLLVPTADPDSLAAAILKVLSDAELKQRLASNGRLRAQDFSADTIAAAYGDLFQRVATVA